VRLLRFSIFSLGIALMASGCLAGTGSSAGGPGAGAVSSPDGFVGAPDSGTLFTSKADSAGDTTMPPRSSISDGLGGGDVTFIAFRAFLSPRAYNTQEPSETPPESVEAKDILNLVFFTEGGLKAMDPEAPGEIGWTEYLQGPYIRIVRSSKTGISYQDQFGQSVSVGDKEYNGAIKELPVSEGDSISIYLYDVKDPTGTTAETSYRKPSNYSETLTSLAPDALAAFVADANAHQVAHFTIKTPAAASTVERAAIPSGTPITRPDAPRAADFLLDSKP
jgi:hypothetical protein